VASIAAGTAVTVGWDWLTPHLPARVGALEAILPALVASLLGLVVVSLATKRPTEEHLRPFEG
jgi:SSS family solute:Na+ symporter/sodium/proline symporter